jgi:elongation factor 1 alpha-like protein
MCMHVYILFMMVLQVSWSESRFNEIREHLEPFLLQTGFRTSSVKFIPCSGISGENLRNRDKKNQAFSWYRGPTLISCIGRCI